MFRKLFGANRKPVGRSETRPAGKDEAIIHLTVPDEVLRGDRKEMPAKDMSWLDDLPLAENEDWREVIRPARVPVSPRVQTAAKPAVSQARQTMDEPETVNARSDGRPRFPYGWLVIVEGPGTGEWFPLERGTSVVGPAEGLTVQLDFGDGSIGKDRVAKLTFDETRHAFALDSNGPFRLNGDAQQARQPLRDGDVFTIGGTSLRLVALCSRNFHWTKDIAAE